MSSKKYLSILLLVFVLVFISFLYYIYSFKQKYPLPITNRTSLDAKLKFIRENIDINKIDTLIIGSSVGLNNLQGEVLEKESKRCKGVLNISVHGAYTIQALELLELAKAFPNLKRVIYSTQYTDLGIRHRIKNYNPKLLVKYITKDLNPIEEFLLELKACNNIPFCIKRAKDWNTKHQSKKDFQYMVFDKSGSIPMYMYGDDIHKGRWNTPQPGYMPKESFDAIDKMAKKAKKLGAKFYLLQHPYRQAIIDRDKRVKNSMEYFEKVAKEIVLKNSNAYYINLHKQLKLSDDYFIDRNHLNSKGSRETAKEVAKFIDEIE